MEEIIALVLVAAVFGIFIIPVIALVMASRARREVGALKDQIQFLREQQVRGLESQARLMERMGQLEAALGGPGPLAAGEGGEWMEPLIERPAKSLREVQPSAARVAPRIHEGVVPVSETAATEVPTVPRSAEPPPLKPVVRPPVPSREFEPSRKLEPAPAPSMNLEQFMGVKLFAWVGGLALFLGVILFVKLSIDRGWISPELRTVIGFLVGVGLVGGGMGLHRRGRYATLAHTLCATGVVVLYGVTFAAHSIWRIAPLDRPLRALALMAAITGGGIWLAVRLNAQVVAVLGMLGGFLAPVLCSTGRDNPLGLFGYVVLLDLGVMAVAKRRNWHSLVALAAGGTILMQAGWMAKFFHSSSYAMGAATWVPVTVFLGFAGLFALAAWWFREDGIGEVVSTSAALALCGSALVAGFAFLQFATIADRPLVLYTLVLGALAAVMAVVWHMPRWTVAQSVFAVLIFLHLALWTTAELTRELLPAALGIYVVFGLSQTVFTAAMERRWPTARPQAGWMPVATLVLLLLPVLRLESMSLAVWPVVLLINLVVVGLAVRTSRLLPVVVAFVLTMLTAGAWLLRWPKEIENSLAPFLLVVAGFAVFFGVAGGYAARKSPQAPLVPLLPVSAAVLPFLLLVLAATQLGLADPLPLFGVAMCLVFFLFGLARFTALTAVVPVALAGAVILQWTWHQENFSPLQPVAPMAWYLGFYAVFTAFPFVFRKFFATCLFPWITSAAAGIGAFSLVYHLVKQSWPNDAMGVVPAAFAIAPLLGFAYVCRHHPVTNPARLTQLAWFGGVALLFITLIFPIQFEKQWITLGWALEGAALCWLFRRVPHPGLRAAGTALLGAAFVRLALNPAVLEYQIRGDSPILNWQLYAYSIAALALFVAAISFVPPHHRWEKFNLRALFFALGGILLFLLLNVEIADAFTPAGQRSIVFEFSGNFARDMTYSIAWAMFALALLVLGIWRRSAPTRYAAIGLLGVTLLKLFLHDLARIGSGYRIGALIGVALVALLASFLYQRFFTGAARSTQSLESE
ncbi:MAG: DUF2339 domain-containing protein [Verrucomicrobiales bacterium]